MFLGRTLCKIAIGQIAELTNTKIETASVKFHYNGSVFIEDLVISPYKKQSPGQTILSAKRVHARFDVGSLLMLRPTLKRIDVNDFVFDAQYDLDTGGWNLSALKITAPGSGSGQMPLVRLERGTLQYSKVSNGQVKVAASVPLAASFGPDELTQDGYSFDIKTAALSSGYGESHLEGRWRPGIVTIAGGISSADVPALEMAWTIDVIAGELKYDSNDAFSLKLRISDLHSKRSPLLDRFAIIGPDIFEKSTSFGALRRFFSRYSPSGSVDIQLDASGNWRRLGESTLTGQVLCKDVAICYHKFQYPIEHLSGRIDFTRNSVTLNNLSGRHGEAELFFNGWTRGYAPDWKYDIRITSDNMALDEDLHNALGAEQKEFWAAYSPSGRIGVDYHFARESSTDRKKRLAVELHGVDALYRNFPYPLKNLTGRLSFGPDTVTVSDVVSRVNGRSIAVNGEVTGCDTDGTKYDISIKLNNMPLDSALQAALPDKQKDLYNQFRPSGLAEGLIRVSSPKQAPAPPTFIAEMAFRDASLKLEQFPQRITDVTANVVFTPDLINVRNLEGRCGDSPVSLAGQIRPGREDRRLRYELSLKFKDAALNEDLFSLFPPSAKKTIAKLQPRGKVNLTAELNKTDAGEYPDYKITVDCLGNSVNLKQFSYPLKDITGTLTITPDAIELKNINAAPGDTVWVKTDTSGIKNLNGRIVLTDDAFGGAVLRLDANDIFFDESLDAALPQALRPFRHGLLRGGRFDLNLRKIEITPADDGEKFIDFTGVVTLKNCLFKISGARTRLDAELTATGLYKTGSGLKNCRVFLDDGTFEIQGKSFTNLTAQIDYDNELREWKTEDLRADCYGGKLIGKFELKQPADAPLQYVLQTGFEGIDLRQYLLDTKLGTPGESDRTTGKMNGSLSISARPGDDASRIGTCRLSITDMRVGKLSPLAKMLQVLRFSGPTEFAFDRMFVDSYIKHNRLVVRKLDLSGHSLAFYGSGSMDLQTRSVDLVLITRGKRLATADPSILASLTEGLGRAVVQLEVTGDFYDPQIATRPLPVIEETFWLLGGKPDEQKKNHQPK